MLQRAALCKSKNTIVVEVVQDATTHVRKSLTLVREREEVVLKAMLVPLGSTRGAGCSVVHKVEGTLTARRAT